MALHQSVFSRLAGYEDTDHTERLIVDPTMRPVPGDSGTHPEAEAPISRVHMTTIDPIITGNTGGQRSRCALHGKASASEPLDGCFNGLLAAPQRLGFQESAWLVGQGRVKCS